MQATFTPRREARPRRPAAGPRAPAARSDNAGAGAGVPRFVRDPRSASAADQASAAAQPVAAAAGSARPAAPAAAQDEEQEVSWLSRASSAIDDFIGDVADTRPDEARLDAEEDLADFMSQGYALANHHPDTGRGLFDASYDPPSGDLVITLKLCFNFVSGDPTNAAWIAAVGGPAAAAAFAPHQFVWQAGEAEAWKNNAIGDVQNAWSEQYTFHNTRPYWEALPAVHVRISIVEVPADQAHFVTTTRKWPQDGGPLDSVTPPAAGANQSTARFEESADNGITNPDRDAYTTSTTSQAAYGIVDTANPVMVFFDLARAEVSPADSTALRNFGRTLGRADMPPFPVTVTGHASSEGAEDMNMRLSEDRARAVSNEIVQGGAQRQPTVEAVGERGAAPTAAWRVVDITVGSFVSGQETVRHEFGHMFGLGDEYPGASRPVGTPVAHSALAQRLIPGQQPVVATDSDSIMSTGETIRPYHYVTFLEALGTMTGTTGQWAIGPAAPRGPGDFPAPAPGGPQAA